MIVVFQRVGYRPPVEADYASTAQGLKPNRDKIAGWLYNQRHELAMTWWFNYPNTVERLKYKPKR